MDAPDVETPRAGALADSSTAILRLAIRWIGGGGGVVVVVVVVIVVVSCCDWGLTWVGCGDVGGDGGEVGARVVDVCGRLTSMLMTDVDGMKLEVEANSD